MKKLIVYACDRGYFDYTLSSYESFLRYNNASDWNTVFVDVGLDANQRLLLSNRGIVQSFVPCSQPQQHGIIYPSARARLEMLTNLIEDDTLLLYLDSDTLIYSNLDSLINDFLESGHYIGVAFEDVCEFYQPPASYAWRNNSIPSEFLEHRDWTNLAMCNTGVFLAKGSEAKLFGERALALYDKYKDLLMLGEQSIVVSMIHGFDIPYYKIPISHNCFVFDHHLYSSSSNSLDKYLNSELLFQGSPIAIRHFCSEENKVILNRLLPRLHTERE